MARWASPRLACLPLALTAAAAVACGDSAEPGPKQDRVVAIDEHAGTYRGVRLGHSTRRLVRVLGRPSRRAKAAKAPLPDVTLPYALPEADQTPPFTDAHWSYGRASVMSTNGRVYGFIVTDPGVETRRAVGVRDDLDAARRAYPSLDCEPADMGEYGEIEKCDGQLAPRRHVWFGGDPIDVIVLADRRIG